MSPSKSGKDYLYAVGRRKSSVARVRLYVADEAKVQVNGKPVEKYFSTPDMINNVFAPLDLVKQRSAGRFEIKVKGGGLQGQSESVRHGLARILIKLTPELRSTLKKAGFLRRDPRVKERKKPGLKRARRAPQWQKR